MEPGIDSALLPPLEPGQASIVVLGPWLAVARFALATCKMGEPWRLGEASNDEFRLLAPNSPSGRRPASMAFVADCPMGPALAPLQEISRARPALAFAVGHHDPRHGLETLWLRAGDCKADHGGGDLLESELEHLQEGWALNDRAAREWMLHAIPIELDPDWLELGELGSLNPDAARQASLLLAGGAGADSAFWLAWPEALGRPWQWTPAPWSPPPPWGMRADEPFETLGRMGVLAGLPDADRKAAAAKALALAASWEEAEPGEGARALAQALRPARADPASLALWRLAARHCSRAGAFSALARALEKLGMKLREIFSAIELGELARERPQGARALLETPNWGYSDAELADLARHGPPAVASVVERRLLAAIAESARARSSSGRL